MDVFSVSIVIIVLILLCFAVTIFLSSQQEDRFNKKLEQIEERHRHELQDMSVFLKHRMHESFNKEVALFDKTYSLIHANGNDFRLQYENSINEFSKYSERWSHETKDYIRQLFEKMYRDTITSLTLTQSQINEIENKIDAQSKFTKEFSINSELIYKEILSQISVQTRNIQEEIIHFRNDIQSIIANLESTSSSLYNNIKEMQEKSELLNLKNNDNFQDQINSMKMLLKEIENIVGDVIVTNQNRDSLSEKYLGEFNQRSEDLKTTTELMYNDFDLLLELLKAGLMNDLIKDMKMKSLS
jgi:hypothetical protein